MSAAIPITVLTGFLGSGKTTVVNRILAGSHGRRLAVIVNEFGDLGIDGALVTGASGQVIELANGCICCATRGDLQRSVREIIDARADLDGILIETSGLADPVPVIMDLEMLGPGHGARLDGVVAVIDAENFDRNLESAEAAYQQITCADLFLINKVDLVTPETPALIETGLRQLNARAGVLTCVRGHAPLDVVLGRERSDVPIEAPRAKSMHANHATHMHDGFRSAALFVEHPLDEERFTSWLDALPASVYRAKGFVRFAGMSSSAVVHAVGARRSVEPASPHIQVAGAALVVIGLEIAAKDLEAGLASCVSRGVKAGCQHRGDMA